MLLGRVLFQGTSTLNQLEKIFEVVGRPTAEDLEGIDSPAARTMISAVEVKHQITIEKLFSGFSDSTRRILESMIRLNPAKRVSAYACLKDKYISSLLVEEMDMPDRYKVEKHNPQVNMRKDDNGIFEIKEYEEYIQEFIERKMLKHRRFEQKTRMIQDDMDRQAKMEQVKGRQRDKLSHQNVSIKSAQLDRTPRNGEENEEEDSYIKAEPSSNAKLKEASFYNKSRDDEN